MPTFDIDCVQIGEPVRIDFGGDEVRGHPDFRGFSCEHEGECHGAGIRCALFDVGGIAPFNPRDAFEHFNS